MGRLSRSPRDATTVSALSFFFSPTTTLLPDRLTHAATHTRPHAPRVLPPFPTAVSSLPPLITMMMKLVSLLALTASASGLMVRDKAPDFKAQAVVGDDFEEVSLSQYTEVGG